MKTIKIIDLLVKIANGEEVPKKIKASGKTWTYEKGFSQYKNSNCQELIKYLDGHYSDFSTGLTYKAIFNYEIEPIEEDKEIEKGIKPFKEYWEEVEVADCNKDEASKVYLDRLSKIVIELVKAVNELKKGK